MKPYNDKMLFCAVLDCAVYDEAKIIQVRTNAAVVTCVCSPTEITVVDGSIQEVQQITGREQLIRLEGFLFWGTLTGIAKCPCCDRVYYSMWTKR